MASCQCTGTEIFHFAVEFQTAKLKTVVKRISADFTQEARKADFLHLITCGLRHIIRWNFFCPVFRTVTSGLFLFI